MAACSAKRQTLKTLPLAEPAMEKLDLHKIRELA